MRVMRAIAFTVLSGCIPFIGVAQEETRTLNVEELTKTIAQHHYFQKNVGQVRQKDGTVASDVLYVAQSPGVNVYITKEGISYVYFEHEESYEAEAYEGEKERALGALKESSKVFEFERVDMFLPNANTITEEMIEEVVLPQVAPTYYYLPEGNQKIESKAVASLMIRNIKQDVDWRIYFSEDGLKYDFIVKSQNALKDVEIAYASGSEVELSPNDGRIRIALEAGTLEEFGPVSFYEGTSLKTSFVEGSKNAHPFGGNIQAFQFAIDGAQSLHLSEQSPLVIDPFLEWSSFLGGNNLDGAIAITSDSQDNVYVVGYNSSTDYPLNDVGGYFVGTVTSTNAGFITKFNAASVMQWSTYVLYRLPGRMSSAITDSNDNLLVAGYTNGSIPLLNSGGYFDGTSGGLSGTLMRFDPNANLTWGTYYDSPSGTTVQIYDLTIDANDNVYVVGGSSATDLPTLNAGGYFAGTNTGSGDLFIARFDNTDNLTWASYFGGTGSDLGLGIDIAPNGNIYALGFASSTNLPTLNGGGHFQGTNGGSTDIFYTIFDPATNLLHSSYHGGSNQDVPSAIDFDEDGNLFMHGYTRSTNFPTVDNGTYYQATSAGGLTDYFISKWDASNVLEWSTYFGGGDRDETDFAQQTIAVDDSCGQVVIIGKTLSTDMPTLQECSLGFVDNALDINGNDQYLAKFENSGTMIWGSYFGGDGNETGSAIVFDGDRNLYATGEWIADNSTVSNSYPHMNTITGAFYDATFNGVDDSFIAKFVSFGATSDTSTTIESCGSCDAQATVSVTNLCPPYDYIWSNGVSTMGTMATSNTITGLCSGMYYVTINSANCDTIRDSVMVNNNCVLPVELVAFDAQPMGNKRVHLTWTTATEKDNDFFTLERSRDALSFNEFAIVSGAGNSTTTLHYEYYDEDPYPGISYYRLKQTDFDGAFSYSLVRSVLFTGDVFLSIYPNPVQDVLEVEIDINEDDVLHMQILDRNGRTVKEKEVQVTHGVSTFKVDTQNLATGAYTLRIQTSNSAFVSQEFVKQ